MERSELIVIISAIMLTNLNYDVTISSSKRFKNLFRLILILSKIWLTLMRFCPSTVEVNPTRVFLQRLLHTLVRLCINASHSIRKLCKVAPQPVRYEHFNWANRQEFGDDDWGNIEVEVVTLYSKQCKTLENKLIKIKSWFWVILLFFSLSWLFSNCWVFTLVCWSAQGLGGLARGRAS